VSHDPHEGADGTLVYDNCAECDSRAADPLEGLLHYDAERFAQLHERMVNVEYRNGDHYRSSNEARVCKALYYVRLLTDRHAAVFRG
jgi:hypothetical protein